MAAILNRHHASHSKKLIALPMLGRALLVLMCSVITLSRASAQTIFDNIPAQCGTALKLDIVATTSSSAEQLAYLGTIDQQSYEEIKHGGGASLTIPIEGIPIGGTADYNDFDQKRNALFQQIGYTYNQSSAYSLLSQTTSARAFKSFDTCMELMSKTQVGFKAWRQSEDLNDVIIGCHWNAPPAGMMPGGIVRPITVSIAVQGRSKKNFKIGAGDDCTHIVIPWQTSKAMNVVVSGGGSSFDFAYTVGPPTPPNIASISYFPLQKIDGVQTADQGNLAAPFGQGTPNMNGGPGCPSNVPPIACDGTRKHLATSMVLSVDPPADGDLYDPGQSRIVSFRDVGGDGGSPYCDQFSVQYLQIPPPPANAAGWPPDFIQHLTALQGKHQVSVISRCWGYPVLITATVPSFHMVPSPTAVNADAVHFNPGESIIFSIDQGAISKIQFTYGHGAVDIVKAGDPTTDGKIVCLKTFVFSGKVYYVYQYTA